MAVGLLVGLLLRSPGDEVAEIGRIAPDFTVPLLDAGEFTLSEQLRADDRPILLNLWASWCIPCRVETPELSAFAQSHPEIKVLGVAVQDTEPQAKRFADQFQPFHDLGFGDEDFRTAYPSLGLPATYWIEPDGRIGQIIYGILNTQMLEDLISS